MCGCERALELMSLALDGGLTEEERRELDGHLAQCEACRSLAEDLAALHAAMPEEEEVPAGLHEAVMERVRAEKVLPLEKKGRGRWKSWAAMAAVFAVVLAGAGTLSRYGGLNGASGGAAAPQMAAMDAAPAEAAGAPDGAAPEAKAESGEPGGAEGQSAEDKTTNSMALDGGGDGLTMAPRSAIQPISGEPEAAPGPEETPGPVGGGGGGMTPSLFQAAPPSQRQTAGALTAEGALDLVVDWIFGQSGYELVREDASDGEILSCHVALMDGDEAVADAGGTVAYDGENEGAIFFSCTWDEGEEVYHYSVDRESGDVSWVEGTPRQP